MKHEVLHLWWEVNRVTLVVRPVVVRRVSDSHVWVESELSCDTVFRAVRKGAHCCYFESSPEALQCAVDEGLKHLERTNRELAISLQRMNRLAEIKPEALAHERWADRKALLKKARSGGRKKIRT